RMILERALVQGNVADEQMPEIDGASRLGKSGRHHDATGAGAGAERLADRPDVSRIGRVESRADLVDDVARPAGGKPVIAGDGRRDGALSLDRADFQRDDDRIRVAGFEAGGRDADRLDRRETVA